MNRYWQQMIVPEIGATGQQRIAAAKVLVIGAGGLGTPVAVYLAAAGVNTIGIADGDIVSVSNLSRQFLYDEKDTGHSKAKVLAAKLTVQNPGVSINVHDEMLDKENGSLLIASYDVVCDCTDNAVARIFIDSVCRQLSKPLVYGVVKDWEGYVTVLHHTKRVSLQDIFAAASLLEQADLNCSVAGIVNTTCGIAGSIQACEALKIILGLPGHLDGGILCFNSLLGVFRVFTLQSASQRTV